ncbi:uncharacterized protein LOC134835717 [Culicoides brevitarsis]|uniref:uncharacterized protein LOC134835717 n=1 Tax=Culicoides brevitarsis TaxID=469753 RepID=UPI00307B5B45
MFSITFIILIFPFMITKAAKFDIFVKSLRCYDINPKAFENASCILKVTRDTPTGLTKLKADALGVSDIYLEFSMFYRYTGGFKPYLLSYSIDACDLVKHTTTIINHEFIRRFVFAFKSDFGEIFKGCPYNGHLESSWMDGNASFSSVLPPVIPQGRYKFIIRLSWLKQNETICIIEFQSEVKPRKEFRDMDFSMLNMG